MGKTHRTQRCLSDSHCGEDYARRQACKKLAAMVVSQMQRRRQIQPVTAPTQWEAVELLRNNGFTIDQARLDRVFNDPRAQPVHGNVSITVAGNEILGLVKGTYHAKIVVAPTVDCDCDCPDWFQSGGKANQLPCKHILGLAVDVSLAGMVPQAGQTPTVQPQTIPVVQPVAQPARPVNAPTVAGGIPSFPDQVGAAIGRAVEALADQVQAVLDAGEIPFLIGPTDCGKTSAVRRVVVRNGWLFEPVEGCESYADLDLVGAIIDGKRLAGPFARAFGQARPHLTGMPDADIAALLGDLKAAQAALAQAQAQVQVAPDLDPVDRLLAQVQLGLAAARQTNGQKVLIFLDEFTRFNTRAMDILMTPLLPTPPEVARLMGIETTEDVRYVNAPLWGREWAPAVKAPVVLACNPWGSSLDPALLRRTLPVQVDFAPEVSALFRSPLKDAVEKSWEMAREGRLPLPVGYKALRAATAPDDHRFMTTYLLRLRAADPAAAEGYRKIVEAAGFRF